MSKGAQLYINQKYTFCDVPGIANLKTIASMRCGCVLAEATNSFTSTRIPLMEPFLPYFKNNQQFSSQRVCSLRNVWRTSLILRENATRASIIGFNRVRRLQCYLFEHFQVRMLRLLLEIPTTVAPVS